MAGVQQVDQSLGGKLEANLHTKSHAEGNQQQVLPKTVLLPCAVPPGRPEVPGRVDLPQRQPDLQQGDEEDHQTLAGALLGRQEGCALGASVPLKLGVHPAVDPIQEAVHVISGHIHLLVLEQIRTRWNERRHTDFLAKHEQRDFPLRARPRGGEMGMEIVQAESTGGLPHPRAEEELELATGGSCCQDYPELVLFVDIRKPLLLRFGGSG